MNYSFLPIARLITVHLISMIALVASLGSIGIAFADELIAPAELDHLRQVSQALLVSRAVERQRLLDASVVQHQALADVDSRLRNLEAAVREDNMPRLQVVPTPRAEFANDPPLPGATAIAQGPALTAAVAQDRVGNSTKVSEHIDDVWVVVTDHKRSLNTRTRVEARSQTSSNARSNTRQSAAPSAGSEVKLSNALIEVETELQGMRAHGADLQRVGRLRKLLSLSGPPAVRDLEPTFQTITRHYR